MVAPATDMLKNSVRADEFTTGSNNATPFTFSVFAPQMPGVQLYSSLPALQPYWSFSNDVWLSSTIYHEDWWASAVNIAITKVASKSYEFEGTIQAKKERAQEMFNQADNGNGFYTFIIKVVQDYLTCDNGAFIEIVRAGKSPNSPVIGFGHLDSWRCMRTNNPQEPVIYKDINGAWHTLKWYQVWSTSDMVSPRAQMYGVGVCAARRTYRHIRLWNAINSLQYNHVTGEKPSKINFLLGISNNQLLGALTQVEAEKKEKEISRGVTYGSAINIPMVNPDKLDVKTVEFAGMPENFDIDKELPNYLGLVSNNIGLPWQDLKPLAHQGLGMGTQSLVLDAKSKGQGLILLIETLSSFFNFRILPGAIGFHYFEDDFADRKKEAEIFSSYSTSLASLVGKDAHILDDQAARQVLVDKKLIDPAQLGGSDVTPYSSLMDDDKPDSQIAPEDVPTPEQLGQAIRQIPQQLTGGK